MIYTASFAVTAGLWLASVVHSYLKPADAPAGSPPGSPADSQERPAAFDAFQRNYLVCYLLAMCSDWLNGPYVYALYQSYGFSIAEISVLFVAGFGASLFIGTIVGALSDKYGRRLMTLVFAVCYLASAVTKMFPSFWVLMGGRVLSGVATSLLFSVLEAWMVCEHHSRGFPQPLLEETFGRATTGNGIIAVVSGLVASALADRYGYTAPFAASMVPLSILAVIVATTWTENYGNRTLSPQEGLSNAFSFLRKHPRVCFLGAAQSIFEGAMYTFVFLWSPSLHTDDNTDLPYGLIFAVYMVCIMIGSTLFGYLADTEGGVDRIPLFIHSTAAVAMFAVSWCLEDKTVVYIAFLAFEVTCGMFFPTYGTLRSQVIPEDVRAALMNMFRIPVNIFVIILLLKVKDMESSSVFAICGIAHTASLALISIWRSMAPSPTPSPAPSQKPSQKTD